MDAVPKDANHGIVAKYVSIRHFWILFWRYYFLISIAFWGRFCRCVFRFFAVARQQTRENLAKVFFSPPFELLWHLLTWNRTAVAITRRKYKVEIEIVVTNQIFKQHFTQQIHSKAARQELLRNRFFISQGITFRWDIQTCCSKLYTAFHVCHWIAIVESEDVLQQLKAQTRWIHLGKHRVDCL